MNREMLTVGQLKKAINGLNDDCHIEVTIGDEGYGDGISVERDGDLEGAWVTIYVEPRTNK